MGIEYHRKNKKHSNHPLWALRWHDRIHSYKTIGKYPLACSLSYDDHNQGMLMSIQE